MEEQLARGPMDLPFLMLVVLLTGIGVIMVFSASYATAYYEGRDPTFYFFRQGLFAVAGLAIMYVVSKINYQTFRWLSVFALILAILLLIAVLIPGIHTDRSDNVKRWIAVPGLGNYFVESINTQDYSLIMGLTIFYGVFLVTMNFIIDILYGVVDPRVRLGGNRNG